MKQQVEILATSHGQALDDTAKLIELAGRTCYQSQEKITEDSADRFIRMIVKRGHLSVLEHSWFNFLVCSSDTSHQESTKEQLRILMANGLIQLSQLSNSSWIIGGNARMFYDAISADKGSSAVLAKIKDILANKMPTVFSELPNTEPNPKSFFKVILITKDEVDWFLLSEKRKHWWAMVRFKGCSRAFTHQLVRHRLMAISQESQRYCDESGFYESGYYVTPPAIEQAGLGDWYRERMRRADSDHQKLQAMMKEMGQSRIREDARFLLPNAVCSEIVISCPLKEWQWIFNMRCDSHAQWEIRNAAMEVLRQFQAIFPGCFDDFKIAHDGQSAEWIR